METLELTKILKSIDVDPVSSLLLEIIRNVDQTVDQHLGLINQQTITINSLIETVTSQRSDIERLNVIAEQMSVALTMMTKDLAVLQGHSLGSVGFDH